MRLPAGRQRPDPETNATRFSYRDANGFAEVIAHGFHPFPSLPRPGTVPKLGGLSRNGTGQIGFENSSRL
jgi:hypothetical protein